jgi:hypothetical protein
MYLTSMDISLHLATRKFAIHFNTKLNDVYDDASFLYSHFYNIVWKQKSLQSRIIRSLVELSYQLQTSFSGCSQLGFVPFSFPK